MTIRSFRKSTRFSPWAALFVAIAGVSVAGCESGSGGPGVGTVGGAALGAGASRAIFGNNTSAMLIGGAVGGMAGNATIDRQAEQRRIAQTEETRDRAMQRQLDFERQRALQQAEVEREIEEQRLFNEWRRQEGR
jgi:hypothetical protein